MAISSPTVLQVDYWGEGSESEVAIAVFGSVSDLI